MANEINLISCQKKKCSIVDICECISLKIIILNSIFLSICNLYDLLFTFVKHSFIIVKNEIQSHSLHTFTRYMIHIAIGNTHLNISHTKSIKYNNSIFQPTFPIYFSEKHMFVGEMKCVFSNDIRYTHRSTIHTYSQLTYKL